MTSAGFEPVLTLVNLQQKHVPIICRAVAHKRYLQAAITKPLPHTNSMRRQLLPLASLFFLLHICRLLTSLLPQAP